MKYNKTTLSKGVGADNIYVTISAKDQYGSAINKAPVVSHLSGDPIVNDFTVGNTSNGETKLTFNGAFFNAKGSYAYKVVVGDVVRYVNFTVGENTGISTYTFTNSGKTVDTALNYYSSTDSSTETDSKEFEMTLGAYSSNGYMVGNATVYATSGQAYSNAGATGTAIYVEVLDKDNKVVDLTATNKFINFAANKITVKPVAVSGTSLGKDVLVKLPAGTYTVKAILVDKAKAPATITGAAMRTIAATTFSVSDSQKVATVAVNNTTSSYGVQDLFKDEKFATIKIGETVVNSLTNNLITAGTVVAIGNGTQVNVQKVTIDLPVYVKATDNSVAMTGVYQQEIAINTPVTFK